MCAFATQQPFHSWTIRRENFNSICSDVAWLQFSNLDPKVATFSFHPEHPKQQISTTGQQNGLN